jgi:hypothetical protein
LKSRDRRRGRFQTGTSTLPSDRGVLCH